MAAPADAGLGLSPTYCTDPGFTLRVCTHLLPSSEGRARRAVDSLYEGGVSGADGPQTAQGR
ncbi:hypothetical protein [Streptomyces sp. NBC_00151]|jgi:hypothetical protein|uniref:hypothetical protein n=1 Tax=Streptomyces sp. NBC_00151 TaxID=2975669 RepID=UPI002DDC6E72|nr:hypothetical protein [Streptomyces sp. NBC_00151]WRZ42181.1 hypothetical protein OG915_31575 [Streptomyces sp. NBC_00151]